MGTLVNPLYKTGPDFGHAGDMKVLDSGDVAVAVGDLDLNDLIKVFRARKGFCVTGVLVRSSDIDDATAALIQFGDADSAARFVAASNIGQAGGSTTTLASTGLLYEFTADTDCYLKISTAPGTPVAGTVRAVLFGYMKRV